ncbi:MAG TPA: TonB-dependent receptor, partial [Vicinamibacterales bacterium]|nr:TonB-dependent receptor [Vicinamibacterales bacterium]
MRMTTIGGAAGCLAGFLALAGVAAAQDTTGIGGVAGVVFAGDGKPASGVTICIVDTERCATSAVDGAFRLANIRAGRQHIEVRAPGLPPFVSGHVDVRAGFEARLEVLLPAIDAVVESVNVTAPAFSAPDEVKTSGFLLSARDIGTSAGALQDVSRFTQSLPGVVIGSNDFRNDLIVRGGSPLENLFVVDNIEIPNINAFATSASAGGSVGLIDVSLMRDVTFLTGGYPAPFGNRVSSVLQIALREGDRERLGAQVSAGFLGAGGVVEGPIGNGRGSWIVSARRSFLDVFTSDIGVGGVPVIYALNAKVVYDLSPRDRVWAVNVSGVDRLRLGATASSTSEDSELANLDIRYRGWRSASGVNWQRVFGERGVGLLGVTHSSARVDTAYKDLLRANVAPGGEPSLDDLIARSPVIFSEDSTERETTVKYDYTRFGRVFEKVQIGGALKRIDARYDAAQPLGFDSPYSAEPGSNVLELDFAQASYDLGAYAQATWEPASRVGVTFGGRVDRYGYTRKARLSPRVGVSYRLARAL